MVGIAGGLARITGYLPSREAATYSLSKNSKISPAENLRYNRKYILAIAPLAQLDRASGYEPEGREFESLRAHHNLQ